ncbi:hypothetical protein Tco_1255791 [Tanacetum coccineum]
MQEEVVMSEVPNDHMVNESETHVDVEAAFVEPRSEELVEQGIGQQVQYDVKGDEIDIDNEDAVIVDEETEITKPNVEVNLSGLTGNEAFDKIGVSSEDEPCFDRRKMLKQPRKGMENYLSNDSVGSKYSFDSGQIFGNATEVKSRVYLHAIKTRRNLKLIKIDGQRIRSVSMIITFRAKAKAEKDITVVRDIDHSLPTRVFKRIYVCLGALKEGFKACRREVLGLDAYKDALWGCVFVTTVNDFQRCMLHLKKLNPEARERLNKIPPEHWARSHFSGRAMLNNICEVFNGKIVGVRDKPFITLLEYIRE